MYDFFLYEIARLRAGRNKEIVQELKPLVAELRDAFKEADRTSGV
jgi:flagellar protein FliS